MGVPQIFWVLIGELINLWAKLIPKRVTKDNGSTNVQKLIRNDLSWVTSYDMGTQIPDIESLDDYNSQEIIIYQATASYIIFAPHSNIGETMPGWNHVPKPAYNIILSISRLEKSSLIEG